MADGMIHELAMSDDNYTRDLGAGLTLRWSTPADVERVVSLYSFVFRPSADAPLNQRMAGWTRDMFSGRHPHIGPRDFAVVEDMARGTIVASTCLLRYPIAYEGIPIPFGRPEVVATLPEYRNRGLIRAIFDLIHARSAARGDLAQGITGIPYYYRIFGYEYALPMGTALTVYFPAVPELKKDATEPYLLRPATSADIPLLLHLWEREQADSAVTTPLDADYLRWAMEGMSAESLARWRPYIITDSQSRPVGYFHLSPGRWGAEVYVVGLMVEAGTPLTAVLPSALRGLRALAETTVPVRAETPPAGAVRIHVLGAHPLLNALGEVAPVTATHPFSPFPYLWYIRVPDLPRFIQHVAPALEARLAESAQSGYTGELTLDFYRGGLRLAFEDGKLKAVEDWRPPLWVEAKAGFPPLVFLQLLFGHRSLNDLRAIYPDVWAEGEAAPLLEALFPARPSSLYPLD
ncbi:MAG TPA: GNAT family N-acetyltransferase [Ktedonobacterales bacterium]